MGSHHAETGEEAGRPSSPPANASPAEVAALLDALHVAPPTVVPTLAQLVRERLERARREGRPAHKVEWALATLARLERDAPSPVLLHGNFDEPNLVRCGRRGLVAVDPLPCAGDPAYDAGSWVHGNRRPGRRARLDAIVAATGLPRDRVRDWAAIVAVHGRPDAVSQPE